MTRPGKAIVALIASAGFLAGCAATQQARDVEPSGFLGQDFAMLQEGEEDEALLEYVDADAPWSTYHSIKLDPVTIWTGDDSVFEDFSQADRQTLADTFYTLVNDALAQDFQMVDQLGPGVLRVQVAISDAETSNPTMDTISTVLPQGLVLSQAFGLMTGKPGFVGEASAEVRVTDGESGALVGAAVDRRVGGKSITGSTDSWDDVRQAYRYWAERLRYRLCTEADRADCTPPEA